jgi:hypothetical protein
MHSLGFEQDAPGHVQDAMSEAQSHSLQRFQPNFDGEQIVVARKTFEPHFAFGHRENGAGLLQGEQGKAERSEEFATRLFEDVEETRMINMIARGAFGIGDTMTMLKAFGFHEREINARPTFCQWIKTNVRSAAKAFPVCFSETGGPDSLATLPLPYEIISGTDGTEPAGMGPDGHG